MGGGQGILMLAVSQERTREDQRGQCRRTAPERMDSVRDAPLRIDTSDLKFFHCIGIVALYVGLNSDSLPNVA
jgi:hypothetical protein